jgi:hypothetical protein
METLRTLLLTAGRVVRELQMLHPGALRGDTAFVHGFMLGVCDNPQTRAFKFMQATVQSWTATNAVWSVLLQHTGQPPKPADLAFVASCPATIACVSSLLMADFAGKAVAETLGMALVPHVCMRCTMRCSD